jgi:hypothetical protein
MAQGLDILSVKRVMNVFQTLRDIRELPQDLIWTNRTPQVDAEDGEIMARFEGNVLAADIIGDGMKAVVRSTGKYTLETMKIPKFKHGEAFDEPKILFLNRIANGFAGRDDMGLFSNWKQRSLDGLRIGVDQRIEAVLVACLLDSYTYNRLGLKIMGASWGMPSDLKVTLSPLITNTSGSRFIDAVLALKALAKEKYGENFDRLTMTTADFRLWIATDEFTAKAQLYYQMTFPTASFPSNDIEMMQRLAERITGMTIEFYDARYWEQASDGSIASAPYLPEGKVILTSKADDNRETRMDFANGIVTETVVSSLAEQGGMIGSFTEPMRGTVAYATTEHNPPEITFWAAKRGWPRRKRLSSSAVITVR